MRQYECAEHNGNEGFARDLVYHDRQSRARGRGVFDVQGYHKEYGDSDCEGILYKIGQSKEVEYGSGGEADKMATNYVPCFCRYGGWHCEKDEGGGAYCAD